MYKPTPPWTPQRLDSPQNQPGNPLAPGPNLAQPPWNPGGVLPGPAVTRGLDAWAQEYSRDFLSDGTNMVWTWESPVFDLRPGLATSYGQYPHAVPINHEAALGQSVYLVLIVSERTGTAPPAAAVGLHADYFEDGNGIRANNGQLLRLTQTIPVDDTLLAGGISLVAPFGASAFSFTPCVNALRFWKLTFRLTFEGLGAITLPYTIQASLH